MKKARTVLVNGNMIFKGHKLTIGLDLGDQQNSRLGPPTTPKPQCSKERRAEPSSPQGTRTVRVALGARYWLAWPAALCC
jgi:hypothetical protein